MIQKHGWLYRALILGTLLLFISLCYSQLCPVAQSVGPPTQPGGHVYYVAPWGNDANPGTFPLPWRTIQHAANTVLPGDAVYVREGTYEEQIIFSHSGAGGNYLLLAAYPREKVVVRGSITLSPDVAYVQIRGLTLRDYPVWGVSLMGDNHHIVLANMDIGGGEAGIHFTAGYSGELPLYGPVEDVLVKSSVIHDTRFTAVDCTPGPCRRMVFRRLDVFGAGAGQPSSFSGDGIAVERGSHILIEDSLIHDNGGDGIDLNSRDREGNVSGVRVQRNRIFRNRMQGVKLWAGGEMLSNAVWGHGINPVNVGVYTGTYRVINNTIAYNMWDPAFSIRDYAFIAGYPEIGKSPVITLTLVNNIFAFNTGPDVGTPTGIYLGARVQLTEHHNLYYSREDQEIYAAFAPQYNGGAFSRQDIADGTWAAVTRQGKGDVTSDPLFVEGWPDTCLALRGGSPAIDAGSAADAPPLDVLGHARRSVPDIGCCEFQSTRPPVYLPWLTR